MAERKASWPPGRTALYRFFDAEDVLLYIGIAHNPEARWAGHAATKAWWGDVARKTVEWLDEREDADAAETAAIEAEHPKYNVAKSPWAPKPRELGENEMLIGQARANMTEVIHRVRLLRKPVVLVNQARNRQPVAAIVPAEFGEAVAAAGGPDTALAILAAL